MIEAVVYDMDGVLIDSEPFWRAVEMEVFGAIGIDLTEEMCLSTMGLQIDEVVRHWFDRFPEVHADPALVERDVVAGVMQRIRAEGTMKPGVMESVRSFRERDLRLGLASASQMPLIEAVLARLHLGDAFDVVCSTAEVGVGKPNPAIYLAAAARLEVPPERCLAIEDSPNGVAAAKRAGMYCIALPEPGAEEGVAAADLVLGSLEQLDAATLDRF